jgi:hypothetical protein
MALSIQDSAILSRRVSRLVDGSLVAEHRASPFGPHSPKLIEVLDFLRRNPDAERPRYVVLDLGSEFAIGIRSAGRGEEPLVDGADRYPTRGEAEHAVFLRRLRDYGLQP